MAEKTSNPELVEAMQTAIKDNNVTTRSKVVDEIMKATLFMPVERTKTENGDAPNMRLALLKSKDGRRFLPIFTDRHLLEMWRRGMFSAVMSLGFDDMARMMGENMANADGFVINPETENWLFDKKTVESIKLQKESRERFYEEVKTKNRNLADFLREPKDPPTEFMEALRKYLASQKSVNAAWLLETDDDPVTGYVLVTEFARADSKVYDDIGALARRELKHHSLRLEPYSTSQGKLAAAKTEPFYRRRRIGRRG